jgi:hypothetical protein
MNEIKRSEEFFSPFWNNIAPNLHCNDRSFFDRSLKEIEDFDFNSIPQRLLCFCLSFFVFAFINLKIDRNIVDYLKQTSEIIHNEGTTRFPSLAILSTNENNNYPSFLCQNTIDNLANAVC